MDDNSIQSSEFHSIEAREDGSLRQATTYSFHRYRTKLYRVAARLNSRRHIVSMHEFERETRNVYDELDKIRELLPQELCLDSYANVSLAREDDAAGRIFRLQALTLRIVCEHIQILIFRPFITYDSESDSPLTHGAASCSNAGTSPQNSIEMATLARSCCFQSAMRIVRFYQHEDILQVASKTPLVTHLGVLLFTCGVILGTLALQDPTSAHAQECKVGLARLIKVPKICNFSNALWDQATDTLKEVLRTICSEEVETLLVGDFPSSPTRHVEEHGALNVDDMGIPSHKEGIFDGGLAYSNADWPGASDMEVFAECYTAFTDLYGPSIGLDSLR